MSELTEKLNAELANINEISDNMRPMLMGGKKVTGEYKYERSDHELAVSEFMQNQEVFYTESAMKRSDPSGSDAQDYINFRYDVETYLYSGKRGMQGGDQE